MSGQKLCETRTSRRSSFRGERAPANSSHRGVQLGNALRLLLESNTSKIRKARGPKILWLFRKALRFVLHDRARSLEMIAEKGRMEVKLAATRWVQPVENLLRHDFRGVIPLDIRSARFSEASPKRAVDNHLAKS